MIHPEPQQQQQQQQKQPELPNTRYPQASEEDKQKVLASVYGRNLKIPCGDHPSWNFSNSPNSLYFLMLNGMFYPRLPENCTLFPNLCIYSGGIAHVPETEWKEFLKNCALDLTTE